MIYDYKLIQPTSQTSSSIWKHFDEQISLILGQNSPSVASIVKLIKYLNENLFNRQMDHLLWWSERKQIYQRLYEMIKRKFWVLATSVPCKQVFSKAGLFINNKKTKLTTDKIKKLCLSSLIF